MQITLPLFQLNSYVEQNCELQTQRNNKKDNNNDNENGNKKMIVKISVTNEWKSVFTSGRGFELVYTRENRVDCCSDVVVKSVMGQNGKTKIFTALQL